MKRLSKDWNQKDKKKMITEMCFLGKNKTLGWSLCDKKFISDI